MMEEIAELFATLRLEVHKEDFEHANELIESVHHALEAFAVFEGVKWVKEMFEQTQEAASGIKKMSERLGIASEDLQKLRYAADISSASAGELDGALLGLSRRLGGGGKHSAAAVAGLSKLGISMSDPAIKGKNLNQIMMRLSDGFADAGPEIDKTSVAMQIGGRSLVALLPMMKKGSDDIKEMGDEFESLGGVIDDETLEAFDELEHSQKKLHTSFTAITRGAVVALIPQIKELTDGIFQWVKANKELIRQRLSEIFTVLVKTLKLLIGTLGILMTLVEFVVEHWKFFVIVLGEAVVAFAVLERAAIASGAKVMWAWIKAAAPFLVLAAVLALIGIAIDDFLVYMRGGDSLIGRFMSQLEGGWDRIKGGVDAAIAAVVDFFANWTTWPGKVYDAFKDAGKVIYDYFREPIQAAIEWCADKLRQIWDDIKKAANKIKHMLIGESTDELAEDYRDKYERPLSEALHNFRAGTQGRNPDGSLITGLPPPTADQENRHAFLAGTQGRDPNTGALVSGLVINVIAPLGADAAEHGKIITDKISDVMADIARNLHATSGAAATPGTGFQVSK